MDHQNQWLFGSQNGESSSSATRQGINTAYTNYEAAEIGQRQLLPETSSALQKRKAPEHLIGRAAKQTAHNQSMTTATDVVAHQQRERDYALANALAEREDELLSVVDRQDILAVSTRKRYQRYQAHWMAWCRRKRYNDDMKVTYGKFLTYVRELVADEIVQHEDDYHSIRPICINATADYEGDLPSPETIDAYVKAVVDLYEQQKSMAGRSIAQEKTSLRTCGFYLQQGVTTRIGLRQGCASVIYWFAVQGPPLDRNVLTQRELFG
ncbi:hypothetical protein BC939DRAFT_496685 [Gamsiella multidivaricata]|uniref:uncharacterized protein n=1 Tax=Gamsiella multidivaricata TaxID=101098 RepID=UPI00221F953A|nr:uncharacterized protein BC939DRAFT_496685 [Gamsiella multidivaricata]KAI7817409.1 hypothetical protein BC939DRAFT_496685 [Gamsiella multidivaricata]